MKFDLPKKFKFVLLVGLFMLNGCASLSSTERVQDKYETLPVEPTKNEHAFNVLAAEFSGTRGSLSDATNYYMKAARESGDADVANRAANVALYAHRYKDVLEALEIRQKTLPIEGDAYQVRAIAYLNLGNLDAASKSFSAYIFQQNKLNNEAMSSFGQALVQHDSDIAVLDVLSQINEMHPHEQRILLLLARYQVKAKLYDEAMLSINQVLEVDTELSDAYLVQAQIHSARNEPEKALASVAAALEKRPNDFQLRLQYGRMLVQLKKYDDAWEEFMQLRLVRPQNGGVLLSLALLSVETDKVQLAREYFKELIEKSQHVSQAHYYLGRMDQSQDLVESAILQYNQVKKGSFVIDARIRSTGLMAKSGKIEEALIRLTLLINEVKDPAVLTRLYLAHGELLRKLKRTQDAMNVYNAALEKTPENTNLLYARALIAEKLDLLDVTVADLRNVIQQEPNNAHALNALGFTLANRSERLEEAKQYILKAAKLLPNDAAVLDSLGWVYYRLGQYGKATEWLKKAFDGYKDAEIAAHLGEVLWANGQNEEAQRIWKLGLKLNAQNIVLQETLKRYKQ